jgi:hypothetical protein
LVLAPRPGNQACGNERRPPQPRKTMRCNDEQTNEGGINNHPAIVAVLASQLRCSDVILFFVQIL